MCRLKIYLTLLLSIICAATSVQAQENKPPLILAVERVFQEQESKWEVHQIKPDSGTNFFRETIWFKDAAKQDALIAVEIWERLKDAQDRFEGESTATTNNSGKAARSKLANLGDENYLWRTRGANSWPTLKFRKGNVLVSIFAPTVATAERFARHIAGQIPTGGLAAWTAQ